MAKHLNVDLTFTSDTSKVKQDLQELQNTLSRLTVNSAQKSPLGITSEIKTAITDVTKLEVALKNATSSTGTLDLSQFRTELNQAGLSAEKIATQLTNLGPEGKKAFAQLTQSVMNAEIPLKQTSTLLSNFATTLKNTARWQISSSILHGFMGAIQGAYSYAQNLNKSLNNIRIVTGKSADEMADFAEEANNAAQALSTTTTEYTNASLIYYQQGLDDEAVKERTDATVKMANVTRESAEEVSQQMTAIWNNFDDGSKALEYYSDVVTALGAATASSSAEIAEGLEKFAAVADTVGLSYEYATAALATVTATTRQSADVVGNAFKTLFARMEGLKLGETLDDGTDLNKYSKALDAVGISIKNTDGDLKEMDQILDELGAKWQTLAKDQQMALAQTVAGVRQYTQLVALMENYDFFQQNVRIAKNAEGTLQEQFEIYEQSWEAAKKRLTASMQDIYKSLVDEKFFTNLTDSFGKIASSIAKVVESFGGLKGLLPGVGAILLKIFGPELATSMHNFAINMQNFGKSGIEAALKQRESFTKELIEMQSGNSISDDAISSVYQKQGEVQNHLIQKKRELIALNKDLSEEEKLLYDTSMKYVESLGQAKIEETKKLELLQNETNELEKQAIQDVKKYTKQTDPSFDMGGFEKELRTLIEMQTVLGKLNSLGERFADITDDEQGVEVLNQLEKEFEELITDTNLSIDTIQDLQHAYERLRESKTESERSANYAEFRAALGEVQDEVEELRTKIKNGFSSSNESVDSLKDHLEQLISTMQNLGKAKKGSEEQKAVLEDIGSTVENVRKIFSTSLKDIEKIIGEDNQAIKNFRDSIKEVILALSNYDKAKGTEDETAAYDVVTKAIDKLKGTAKTTFTEIDNATKSNENNLKNVKNTIDAVIDSGEKIGTQWTNATIASNNYAQAIENIDQAIEKFQGDIPTLSERFVAFGSAISSFAMTLQSINSIINTIENPDLSAWDKFINITMSLGMIIPSIMSIYKQLSTVFKTNSAQLAILNKRKQEIITSEITETGTLKVNTQETTNNTNAKKINATVNEIVAETEEEVAASSIAASVALGVFVAIIAAAAAGIFLYNKHLERAAESQKKAAEEATEAAKSARDEAEANQELLDSYNELFKKYKNGEAEKSELYDTTNKLADAYGVEGSAIANLTGQYDAFIEKVNKAADAQINAQKALEKDAYEKNTTGMLAAGSEGLGSFNKITRFLTKKDYNYFAGNWHDITGPAEIGYSLNPVTAPIGFGLSFLNKFDRTDEIQQVIEEVAGGKGRTISIEDASDPEQIIKYYEQLAEVKKRLINDHDFKEIDSEILSLTEELEQMEQYYNAAVDHAENYNRLLLEQIGNEENILGAETAGQIEEIESKLKQGLHNKGLNIEDSEINELVTNYLQGLNSEVINRVLAKEELLSQGYSEAFAEMYSNLSKADLDVLASFNVKLDEYKTDQNIEKFKQDLEDYKILDKFRDIEVSIPINLALDINETVLKGKTVNKETWEELQASAPNAEEILGDRDEFNNKSIAERVRLINDLNKALIEEGQEIAKLDEAQKASYERRLKDTQKEQEEKLKEIKLLEEQRQKSPSDQAYEAYTYSIQRAEKELDGLIAREERLNKIIEGTSYDAAASELSNIINSLISDINLVQNATELIGENWTVAAENVEQFVRLMPEIINSEEQLNILEDGSLQLSKEQVALVLNGNEEIINSNKEVVISAIQDKITQLQAENDYYKKQIELLKDSLQNHQNYEKNIQEMDKNTQDYANQLKELGVQVDSDAWDAMVVNSSKGATAIQENLEKIYNRIKEIHDAYGKMFSKDNLNGYNIEGVVETSMGNGDWRADVSTDDIDSYWNDEQIAVFQNQIDSYQESITRNEDLIAQYTGAIAQIKSGAKEVGDAIGRVNSGKAGKAEKDKKGSSNTPDKKDLVDIDKELDLYYDINNAISKINQELERQEQITKRLSTFQEHYAGKTLIASLKKQNDLLKKKNDLLGEQYKNYEKLYEVQVQELGKLKGQIGGQWNGNELQNYAELFQANVDKYNAVVEAYNAMSKTQQQESGKQLVEDAKKVYDKYKEALERYQKLYYNEMYDTENKLAELRQQNLENQMKVIENNLKAWETDIQLKLDMTGLKRDWKAFMHDVEQDFRKIYENLTIDSKTGKDTFGTYVEDAKTRIQQINDVEAELRKMEASKDANGVVQISDDMMFASISEAQEYLKKLQSELVDVGNSLNDMYEEVWDNYIKGLDQAKDNFEDINDELEHLTNMLEYEKELVELIYGDKAYELMSKYYETQQQNIEARINSTRQQTQFWEDQFNKAFEMNRDQHNVKLEDMSTWTEDMRKAYDNMIESQEKLNDLVLEGIKNLKDEYLNNVAKTLSDMDKAIWGMGLDDLKEDWDFLQKKADEYLDDVQGAYKIQSLANKITEGIEKLSDPKAQQKLAKLREDELEMLREKEHLTQSDLDIAEARYEIALKEIALEEAQNNKTSMKLTRDTSGNWTYQYVADEEDTANKRQELLDAYNNLYETANNAYEHAMELAMDMYDEYQQKLIALAEEYPEKTEEYYQKLEELKEQYLGEIQAALENAQIYEEETIMAGAAVFAEVCDQDLDKYATLTEAQKELVDMVKDHHLEDYEEIREAILNDYQEIGDKAKEVFEETNFNSQTAAAAVIDQWDKDTNDSVKGAMDEAFDAVVGYTQDFEDELYNLEEVSGRTIMDPGGVVSDIEAIGDATEEVGYKTQEMAITAESYLNDLRNTVNQVEDAWKDVTNSIQKAIDALEEYLYMSEAVSAEEARREAEAARIAAEEARQAQYSSGSGSGSGGSSSGSSSRNKNTDVAGEERERYKLVSDPNGANGMLGVYDTKDGKYVQITKSDKKGYEELMRRWGVGTGNLAWTAAITGMASGGYTGSWEDQSGKLAFLHQKELVLNSTDTENMLSAVNTVRDIAKLNDSISETIASSIGMLITKALTSSNNINTNNITNSDNTNNTFNITAEFPNANDVQTIRDAILSLPNIASQYVHMN